MEVIFMQLSKHKTDERTDISYTLIGNFYIPDVILPSTECEQSIGIWGQRHREYLRQYKKITFYVMLTNGTLWSYLADINEQAMDMFSRLMDQMAEREGITEKLKEENQMLWVGKMNAIQEAARELVNSDLIYT